MLFIVEPKTWFLTNPRLRNALCLDYKYECKVVFTTYMDGAAKSVRTITYQAVDPMGAEKVAERAVFTTYMDGAAKSVRTITYQAVDPMGAEKVAERAHLLLNSKAETVEIS